MQNQLSAATAKKLSPAAASAFTIESAAPAVAPAAEAMETAAAATDSAASAPYRKESEAEEMMDVEDKGNKVRRFMANRGDAIVAHVHADVSRAISVYYA